MQERACTHAPTPAAGFTTTEGVGMMKLEENRAELALVMGLEDVVPTSGENHQWIRTEFLSFSLSIQVYAVYSIYRYSSYTHKYICIYISTS